MSIRSIAATARVRTQASVQPSEAPQVWTSAASGASDDVQGPSGSDALIKTIPTEVVVLYTTIIGALSGIVKDNAFDAYVPLRWTLYGGCIAATCVAVLLAYYFTPAPDLPRRLTAHHQSHPTVTHYKPPLTTGGAGLQGDSESNDVGNGGHSKPQKSRRSIPLSETVISVFSFAIWGLVIPGSPLYGVLHSPTLPVVVTVLSATGAFAATAIFAPWLNQAAKAKKVTL